MLAFRLLARNWRSGELKLLTIALVLAVTMVTGISIFVDRLESSLQLQTTELLGADLVVVSPSSHPDAWRKEADRRGVKHTDFVRLQTMAYADDENTLISLHVVKPDYPLRGQLFVANTYSDEDPLSNRGVVTDRIPLPGNVWVQSELFFRLDLKLNQRVEIGDSVFTISKVLTDSPESFSRYPIVMMNHADLEQTGIIMPGSQVRYRWLLASDDKQALTDFTLWLENKLSSNQEISDAHSRSDWLRDTVAQSTTLLSFSAIISVLLAGVTIAIATRQFVERHSNQVAVIKSFGTSRKRIRQLYFGKLLILAGIASGFGVFLGHVMQEAIAIYMQQFIDIELVETSPLPYLYSLLSGVIFLLFFSLPSLWHLPNIPPLRVLRNDIAENVTRVWVQVLLAGVALISLIALFSKDVHLTLKVGGALLLIVMLTLFFAWMTLLITKKIAKRSRGFWRLGLVNLQRRSKHNALLIAVFSTTLMALLSLTLIRNSFWQEIQDYVSIGEINFFLMNISIEQKPLVEEFLNSRDLPYEEIYPTVVGRISEINGLAPSEKVKDFWVFKSDVWMTWFDRLPEDQALLAGKWWPEIETRLDGVANVSIRADIAENVKLKVDDILTLSINGESKQARISSIRPNLEEKGFSLPFVFNPIEMSYHHHIYNTGVNIPKQYYHDIFEFGRSQPTIIIESLDAWLEKTQKILERALDGALFVLLITLVSGCLVLFAAVNSSLASRRQESGLLRAFGSTRRLILGSVWVEFLTVGFISGLIAIVASEVLFHQVQTRMGDVPFTLHYLYWPPVVVGGALMIAGLGVAACISTVSTPPNQVLRSA